MDVKELYHTYYDDMEEQLNALGQLYAISSQNSLYQKKFLKKWKKKGMIVQKKCDENNHP